MSRFVDKSATVEIVLANGDTIKIREKLTALEQAKLSRDLIRVTFNPITEKVQLDEGDWHLQQVSITKAHLVGWDFKDDDGKEIPCTPVNIELLDEPTIKEISSSIAKYQKAREDEAQGKENGR